MPGTIDFGYYLTVCVWSLGIGAVLGVILTIVAIQRGRKP
jgi:hypothetical protein